MDEWGISGNATGQISLGNKSHGWMWNLCSCNWLDFTGKYILWLDMEFVVMLLARFH